MFSHCQCCESPASYSNILDDNGICPACASSMEDGDDADDGYDDCPCYACSL